MTVLVLAAMLAQAVAGPGAGGPKGSIRGTVVNEVTGAPVKKATVSLRPMDHAGRLGSAVSDGTGGFSFPDLPAGKYLLRAQHPEYRGSARERAGFHGVDVIVQAGEDKAGVAIALTPTAAVSGKVVDEDGDPIKGCSAELMRYEWVGDRRTLTAEKAGTTNGDGEYRIYNVEAGRYFLRVSSQTRIPQPHALMPPKDVTRLPVLSYATVFYPSAMEVSGATRLNLAAGGELRGIDFRLPKTQTYWVRGRVDGTPEGFRRPRRAQVFLTGVDAGQPRGISVAQDGSFVFDMVRSGTYVLELDARSGYWAREEVTVRDASVEGITVRPQPTIKMAGEIEIEGADGSAIKPSGQMKVQLSLISANPYFGAQLEPATVAEDGTFAVQGLVPGNYQVGVQGQTYPSYIKSLRLGDRNIQGIDIPVPANEAGPLKISLGTKMGKFDATAEGGNGPVTVVLFPESGRWIANQLSADPQGHYRWEGAEPGEYRVFAVEGEDGIILHRGDVRKALEGQSAKVKVVEGGTATVSLTVISRETLERVMQENG